MWQQYYTVSSIEDALRILREVRENARIIAGGTDLVLEIKNGLHNNIHTLIDITRVENANSIIEEDNAIILGPTVTHNQCLVSDVLKKYCFPLVKAAYSVGAPQIRNVGTIVGNLVTASPANDTITPLIALNASLKIRSVDNEYVIKLADFYKGVRKTSLKSDEMIAAVIIPKMDANSRGAFQKYLLRETHAISVANVCALLSMNGEKISKAIVTLGAVAPTIIRAKKAEEVLTGSNLTSDTIKEASAISEVDAKPISDIRASKDYRSHLIPVLLRDALESIKNNTWNQFDSNDPVLLWGKKTKFFFPINKTIKHDQKVPITTIVNKKEMELQRGQNTTLLDLIREEAKLTGTKLGCGEGECGACTMHLNGLPVFACLLPAPKAHQNEITTIEGIAEEGKLAPIQNAFIDAGAVQCGYCTPGFIMSAVKLLEEKPQPTELEIKQGLAGNICRCTGYYKIIKAVELAANQKQS